MADFAPNFTPRLKVTYRVFAKNHSFVWRLPIGTAIGDVGPFITKVSAFLAAMQPALYADWAIVNTTFAAGGSDVFLPVANPTTPTGAIGTGGRSVADGAMFVQFVGRGNDGARGSFYLYGTSFTQEIAVGADWRIQNAENAVVSAVTGILNETPPRLVAIDDSLMNWYSYVNLKANDHWVHRIRTGG